MVFPFFSHTSCPFWREERICSRQGWERGLEREIEAKSWGVSNANLHEPSSAAAGSPVWGGEGGEERVRTDLPTCPSEQSCCRTPGEGGSKRGKRGWRKGTDVTEESRIKKLVSDFTSRMVRQELSSENSPIFPRLSYWPFCMFK